MNQYNDMVREIAEMNNDFLTQLAVTGFIQYIRDIKRMNHLVDGQKLILEIADDNVMKFMEVYKWKAEEKTKLTIELRQGTE